MSKKLALAAAFAATLGLSAPAMAQYVGPSEHSGPRSVAEILRNPVDDQDVTLTGVLIRKVGHEKYIFSDGTGEIRVEIDDDDFPTTPIDADTRIVIKGEVEKDFMESPEIDVDWVRIS